MKHPDSVVIQLCAKLCHRYVWYHPEHIHVPRVQHLASGSGWDSTAALGYAVWRSWPVSNNTLRPVFFGDSNGSIHLQVDWVPRLSKLAILVSLPPTTDIQTNRFTPCACVRVNNRYLTVHTSNKPQQIHVWIAWEVLSGPQLWHSGTWSHWLSHTHDYQDCDPKDSQEVL